MTIGWTVAVAAVFVALIASLVLVRQDSRRGEQLSEETVVVVWVAYLLHAAVVATSAWKAPLGRLPWSPAWTLPAGAVLMLAGVLIAGAAVRGFASLARMSGRDTERLITSGAYALSRNPQNAGWLLALAGASLAGRSLLAWALTAGFAVVVHLYLVTLEEPHLEGIYGGEYRRYRRQVARYLGRRR
jgi:protein-S-isoprenylcysteine O-methyltransferase Ste14